MRAAEESVLGTTRIIYYRTDSVVAYMLQDVPMNTNVAGLRVSYAGFGIAALAPMISNEEDVSNRLHISYSSIAVFAPLVQPPSL